MKKAKKYFSGETKERRKGITLIALVITVIVLLILAGTAITLSINGGNLFSKTNEAANEWNTAVVKEEMALSDYLNYFDKEISYIKKYDIQNVNLYNKDEMKIGYYTLNNTEAQNSAFMCTGYIAVTPGDELFWCAYVPDCEQFDYELTDNRTILQDASIICEYDAEKNYLNTERDIGRSINSSGNPRAWTVPEGVYYIKISFRTEYGRKQLADYLYICKNELPKVYAEFNQTTVYKNCTLYIPQNLKVAVNTTMSVYNENICPTVYTEDLTFKWQCDIGTVNAAGITFNPTSSDIGKHSLYLEIYNNNNNLVGSAKSNIEIVSNTINENKRILLLGDSLSNGKPWIENLETLTNNKLNIDVFAQSGAGTYNYYKYNKIISADNIFYNPESEHFDFSYYMNNLEDEEYDAIMLFLGTNDLVFTASDEGYPNRRLEDTYLDDIISSIRNYSNSLQIYVITPLNNAKSADRSRLAFNFMKSLYTNYTNDSNTTIIPLELSIDPVNDFGTNDAVHPLTEKYNKFAEVCFSYIDF